MLWRLQLFAKLLEKYLRKYQKWLMACSLDGMA
jgi:hypothetical protein